MRIAQSSVLVLTSVALVAFNRPGIATAQSASDPYRPGYHYTAEHGWLNDPNGLIYINGVYHMYYQYTPDTIAATNKKSWGLATSMDLVHWREQPVAIPTDGVTDIWSGAAVTDPNDTAGFGAGAIVAAYTGAQRSHDSKQDQRIAYSTDGGFTFTKYAGNPVIPAANEEFRDPSILWHAPSNSWVMALSRPRSNTPARPAGIEIYRSPDLKNWRYHGVSGSGGCETPDLFEMPVNGDSNNTRWIEMVGVNGGTTYHIGQFDGYQFTTQTVSQADHGQDYYAAQQWNELPQGIKRNVAIAWMANPGYAGSTPSGPWRGALTIPRELTLVESNGTLTMIQRPVAELRSLRHSIPFSGGDVISSTLDPLSGSSVKGARLELLATIDPETATRVGFRVRVAAEQETLVGYDVASGNMFVDRRHSGSHLVGDGIANAPMSRLPDGTIQLHLFVDQSSVEVFGNDGLATITSLIFPEPASDGVAMLATGGTARLVSFEAYRLDSAVSVPESKIKDSK